MVFNALALEASIVHELLVGCRLADHIWCQMLEDPRVPKGHVNVAVDVAT